MPQDPFAAIAQPVPPQPVPPQGADPFAAIAHPVNEQSSWASRLGTNFLSGLGVTSNEQAKNFFVHPLDTVIKSFEAQGQLAIKARDAYEKGDYVEALAHGLNYLVPFIGQQTDQAGEQLKQGDIAGGIGRTLGVAAPIVAGSPSVRTAVSDTAAATADAVKNTASKLVDATRDVTPKQAAQAVGGIAGGVTSAHGGIGLSPIGAYAGAKGAGRLVEAVVGKERANAPLIARTPPSNTGAPLPEAPDPALLQGNALSVGGKSVSSLSDALGTIPAEQQIPGVNVKPSIKRIAPEPVYPGAPLPKAPPSELVQGNALSEGGKPASVPSDVLGDIPAGQQIPGVNVRPSIERLALFDLPVPAVNQAMKELGPSAPIVSLTERANQIADLTQKGLGGKGLEPNVPLKNQSSVMTPSAAKPSAIPEGHTAVESSAMNSYKYDPAAREFEVKTDGGHYVYGDVSPEQAAEFEAAKSKGKAWNDIRKNSTLVAKVVNGKRVSIIPAVSNEDLIPNDEWEAAHQLETQVEGTPRR